MLWIGILMAIFGLISIVRGKIPFVEEYNGIENIQWHSRIEGGAAFLVGVIFICHHFLPFQLTALFLYIMMVAIIAVILEVILHVIM